MPLKLYNTLTRKKESFRPLKKSQILVYHCGPTVYWTQHIGNMRAMVMADLVVRSLKYLGYKVKMVRNYTDVGHLTSDADSGEDKMEKAAQREKLDPKKIADKYIKIFEADVKALNTLEPTAKPRATKNIKEMIEMIKAIAANGYAYNTDRAIYFDVSKVRNYNKLSGQKLDENIGGAGRGSVVDIEKKHPYDFALWFFKTGVHQNVLQSWKAYKDGENGGIFSSPNVVNGEGFPGWHIECSAFIKKYLALTIDIHMGGIEHIPIHHTNEIAQSEAANKVKFVNYWLHNEHLSVAGKKMSKSLGNVYSLGEMIDKGFNPLALRYFFLQAHYRSKQNFTWPALEGAQIALDRLYTFVQNKPAKEFDTREEGKIQIQKRNPILISNYKKEFETYISDDFNIPAALAVVWDVIKDNPLPYFEKKKLILEFDKVLGLDLDKVKKERIKIPAEVSKLANEREKARQGKNWAKADEIRQKISKLGYIIDDKDNKFEIRKMK